jgi:hypothetical protein
MSIFIMIIIMSDYNESSILDLDDHKDYYSNDLLNVRLS